MVAVFSQVTQLTPVPGHWVGWIQVSAATSWGVSLYLKSKMLDPSCPHWHGSYSGDEDWDKD